MDAYKEATKRARLVQSRILAIEAQHARRAYNSAVDVALAEYGDGDGRDISGVYREHFPAMVKEELRRMARIPAELEERSLTAWTIAGRRTHTWRRMWYDVRFEVKVNRL
jgi:hypothetical protein